jgi:hypothetical protein
MSKYSKDLPRNSLHLFLFGLVCATDPNYDAAKFQTDQTEPISITDSEAACLQNIFKNTLFLIKDTGMAKQGHLMIRTRR